MTLAEFLLARIAEREMLARSVIAERDSIRWAPGKKPQPGHEAWASLDEATPSVALDAELVLDECEAKRRIIELARQAAEAGEEALMTASAYGRANALDDVLELLAQPYADHSDYREEWRP